MIKLKKYSEDLEKDFSAETIRVLEENALKSGKSYFDLVSNLLINEPNYFPEKIIEISDAKEKVRRLICLDFAGIREVQEKLYKNGYSATLAGDEKLKDDWSGYTKLYSRIISSKKNKVKLAVRMTQYQGLRVCPYCNRDWVTSRGNASGVDMDHFFPKQKYPILALCMYNLVPCCAGCNKTKYTKDPSGGTIISPFDEEHDLSREISFCYDPFRGRIFIFGPGQHVGKMNLEKAYESNSIEAKELLEKIEMYSETSVHEIREMLKRKNPFVSTVDVYRSIFGDLFSEDSISKHPLSKMKAELFERWKGFNFGEE